MKTYIREYGIGGNIWESDFERIYKRKPKDQEEFDTWAWIVTESMDDGDYLTKIMEIAKKKMDDYDEESMEKLEEKVEETEGENEINKKPEIAETTGDSK